MALYPIAQLIARARAEKYALGYFESWSLDSLQGVIDAAEANRSPIIIGFNGDFLSRPERRFQERLEMYAALGKAAAASATVPCGLIFNECPRDDWVRRACDTGFNLVMPADPTASAPDYVERVKKIVAYAHPRGVAVEAELGELPCGATGHVQSGAAMTDPEEARAFVQQTGIDLLAVSVGNIHILVKGERPLDLDRLEAIATKVNTPLVLHGGTGISAASLQGAIALGVAKVNYGTYLKQRYLAALQKSLQPTAADPHALLGIGGDRDLMAAGRVAVRDAVNERIGLLGCCGKAP